MKSWQFSEEPASTSQFLVSTRGPLAAFLQIRPGAFFESTQSPRKVPVLEFVITQGGADLRNEASQRERGGRAEAKSRSSTNLRWSKEGRRVLARGQLMVVRWGWASGLQINQAGGLRQEFMGYRRWGNWHPVSPEIGVAL
jgi:hypothetical protein